MKHFRRIAFFSLICGSNPLQLVCFVDDIEKASFGDVIVVINSSTGNKDQSEDNPKRGKRCVLLFCKV